MHNGSEGSWSISRVYSREEAARRIAEESGADVNPEDLEEDFVRYGFYARYDEPSERCWHFNGYTGGPGTKPVWIWRNDL